MDHFNYRHADLYVEDIPVSQIAAEFGTPCYVYSRATLERHWQVFHEAFEGHPHKVCYAVKANSNIAILNVLAKLGSGFDIVSQGELERVITAQGNPEHVLFSGVGKLPGEIERALELNIGCFNIESASELHRINDIAGKMAKKAPISLRVNPDIDVQTHPYIATGLKENKFGIDIAEAMSLYESANKMPNIAIKGIGYHIGSQLTDLAPFMAAFDKVYELVKELRSRGIFLAHMDIGGGLGVRYLNENPPSPLSYISEIVNKLKQDRLEIMVEPGRAIAANAGILVTKVEYLKLTARKNFAVVDAAMNDLLRPSLYNAYQDIIPVVRQDGPMLNVDIVGPVCETGDFLGKNRQLAIKEQDLLAVRTTGAYGFTMSSNYNSRPKVAEVLVDKDQVYLIRKRESFQDLFEHEQLLPS